METNNWHPHLWVIGGQSSNREPGSKAIGHDIAILEVTPRELQVRTPALENLNHARILRAGNDQGLVFDDSGLGTSNFFHGVTKGFLVVQIDSREDSNIGIGNVGRIPLAAHADLKN